MRDVNQHRHDHGAHVIGAKSLGRPSAKLKSMIGVTDQGLVWLTARRIAVQAMKPSAATASSMKTVEISPTPAAMKAMTTQTAATRAAIT